MALSLIKGEKVKLQKDSGEKLTKLCVGCNWGAIETTGFFGGKKKEAVDLDVSIAVFDLNNNLTEIVYYGNLSSKDGSIKHSGDDREGDIDGDDGLDNEVVTIDLQKINQNVKQIFVILNSFKGQDFATVPFATLRLYEGTPSRVDSVFANYNIASDRKFSGYVSMILGKIYKHNGEWKAEAIGEPTRDKTLKETINSVAKNFL